MPFLFSVGLRSDHKLKSHMFAIRHNRNNGRRNSIVGNANPMHYNVASVQNENAAFHFNRLVLKWKKPIQWMIFNSVSRDNSKVRLPLNVFRIAFWHVLVRLHLACMCTITYEYKNNNNSRETRIEKKTAAVTKCEKAKLFCNAMQPEMWNKLARARVCMRAQLYWHTFPCIRLSMRFVFHSAHACT